VPQPQPTPRLIVFDLDGTLVDSRRDLADSVNAMLVESGRPPLEVADVTKMVGEGARLLVERALASSEASAGSANAPPISVADALERFLVHYDGGLLNHTRAYGGIPAWLASLQGSAALAVLTNKPRDASVRILEGLGLARYFAEVLGADGPHPRKPDPAALLDLMNRRGVARQDTLFIGDSRIDLETARNAGVRLCLVRYGFGFRFADGELPADVTVIDRPGDDCFPSE
jgi:phosphoglycolate phosphatase